MAHGDSRDFSGSGGGGDDDDGIGDQTSGRDPELELGDDDGGSGTSAPDSPRDFFSDDDGTDTTSRDDDDDDDDDRTTTTTTSSTSTQDDDDDDDPGRITDEEVTKATAAEIRKNLRNEYSDAYEIDIDQAVPGIFAISLTSDDYYDREGVIRVDEDDIRSQLRLERIRIQQETGRRVDLDVSREGDISVVDLGPTREAEASAREEAEQPIEADLEEQAGRRRAELSGFGTDFIASPEAVGTTDQGRRLTRGASRRIGEDVDLDDVDIQFESTDDGLAVSAETTDEFRREEADRFTRRTTSPTPDDTDEFERDITSIPLPHTVASAIAEDDERVTKSTIPGFRDVPIGALPGVSERDATFEDVLGGASARIQKGTDAIAEEVAILSPVVAGARLRQSLERARETERVESLEDILIGVVEEPETESSLETQVEAATSSAIGFLPQSAVTLPLAGEELREFGLEAAGRVEDDPIEAAVFVGEETVETGEQFAEAVIEEAKSPVGRARLAGTLVGSGIIFAGAGALSPRAGLAARAIGQPGEEIAGIGGFAATRRLAGRSTAERLFPNKEPLIFSEEAAIRGAQRLTGGASAQVLRGVETTRSGIETARGSIAFQAGELRARSPAVGVEFETEGGRVEIDDYLRNQISERINQPIEAVKTAPSRVRSQAGILAAEARKAPRRGLEAAEGRLLNTVGDTRQRITALELEAEFLGFRAGERTGRAFSRAGAIPSEIRAAPRRGIEAAEDRILGTVGNTRQRFTALELEAEDLGFRVGERTGRVFTRAESLPAEIRAAPGRGIEAAEDRILGTVGSTRQRFTALELGAEDLGFRAGERTGLAFTRLEAAPSEIRAAPRRGIEAAEDRILGTVGSTRQRFTALELGAEDLGFRVGERTGRVFTRAESLPAEIRAAPQRGLEAAEDRILGTVGSTRQRFTALELGAEDLGFRAGQQTAEALNLIEAAPRRARERLSTLSTASLRVEPGLPRRPTLPDHYLESNRPLESESFEGPRLQSERGGRRDDPLDPGRTGTGTDPLTLSVEAEPRAFGIDTESELETGRLLETTIGEPSLGREVLLESIATEPLSRFNTRAGLEQKVDQLSEIDLRTDIEPRLELRPIDTEVELESELEQELELRQELELELEFELELEQELELESEAGTPRDKRRRRVGLVGGRSFEKVFEEDIATPSDVLGSIGVLDVEAVDD